MQGSWLCPTPWLLRKFPDRIVKVLRREAGELETKRGNVRTRPSLCSSLRPRDRTYDVGTVTLVISLGFSLASTVTLTWLTRRRIEGGKRRSQSQSQKSAAGDDGLLAAAAPKPGDGDTVVQVESQLLADLLPPVGQEGGACEDDGFEITPTYDELVERMLPWWGAALGQTVMLMLLFGCIVLFIDIGHDSLSATVPSLDYGNGFPLRAALCALGCVFSLPLRLESLKYTSMFGESRASTGVYSARILYSRARRYAKLHCTALCHRIPLSLLPPWRRRRSMGATRDRHWVGSAAERRAHPVLAQRARILRHDAARCLCRGIQRHRGAV